MKDFYKDGCEPVVVKGDSCVGSGIGFVTAEESRK